MRSGARQRGPLDRNGLAALSDFKTEAWNGLFRSLEREQSDFLARQPGFRRPESSWPVDPLHTWSRVWEYPYVYHHLRRWRSSRAASAVPRVADVGSGVTFFPFAVARLGFHVLCTDVDPVCEIDLDRAIKHVPHDPGSVAFRLAGEATLPLEDEECDAVYCVSTLEHIPRFEDTVREMARVLKPGGLLLLTIDLDLQGNAAIGPARYTELRDVLRESFQNAMPEVTVHPADVLDCSNGPYPMVAPLTGRIRSWFVFKQEVVKPLLGRPSYPMLRYRLAVEGLALEKLIRSNL